jgi:hypothetical protein
MKVQPCTLPHSPQEDRLPLVFRHLDALKNYSVFLISGLVDQCMSGLPVAYIYFLMFSGFFCTWLDTFFLLRHHVRFKLLDGPGTYFLDPRRSFFFYEYVLTNTYQLFSKSRDLLHWGNVTNMATMAWPNWPIESLLSTSHAYITCNTTPSSFFFTGLSLKTWTLD